MRRSTTLALLSALYLVEGIPFGFQTQALPLVLRGQGVSLPLLGGLELLTLPWLVKPLFAIFVDRYPGRALGRRRAWLLPTQAAATVIALAAALLAHHGLPVVITTLLLLNLCAAVLDVAVDALAVDLLGPGDLGLGNAAQVAGYKVGMLAGGWALGNVLGSAGFRGVLLGMAFATLVVFAITLRFREPTTAPTAEPQPVLSFSALLARLSAALRLPGTLRLLLVIGTYKLGESLIDPMFKLYVVDAGHRPKDVLAWFAAAGLAASIAGSIAGGLLATRTALHRALFLAAALRLGPLAYEWWLAHAGDASARHVQIAVVLENFFGGALTTTLFAFMMSKVDVKIGATHFALFAEVEALGKMPAAALSGVLAAHLGYANVFAIGVALSVAYLGILALVRHPKRAALASIVVLAWLTAAPARAAEPATEYEQRFDIDLVAMVADKQVDGVLGMGIQYGFHFTPALSVEGQVAVVPLAHEAAWAEALFGARYTVRPRATYALFGEALIGFGGVRSDDDGDEAGLASLRAGASFLLWDRYSLAGRLGTTVARDGSQTIFFGNAQVAFEIAF